MLVLEWLFVLFSIPGVVVFVRDEVVINVYVLVHHTAVRGDKTKNDGTRCVCLNMSARVADAVFLQAASACYVFLFESVHRVLLFCHCFTSAASVEELWLFHWPDLVSNHLDEGLAIMLPVGCSEGHLRFVA